MDPLRDTGPQADSLLDTGEVDAVDEEREQTRQLATLDWLHLFRVLYRAVVTDPGCDSAMDVEWRVRDFIAERFPAVAIRTADREVLVGSPPAALRFVLHAWAEGDGFDLAVLLAEQSISSDHVLAALIAPRSDDPVVAARGRGAFEGTRRLQAEAGLTFTGEVTAHPARALLSIARGERSTAVTLGSGGELGRLLPYLHVFEEAGGELPQPPESGALRNGDREAARKDRSRGLRSLLPWR
jgi:hypothetical protein